MAVKNYLIKDKWLDIDKQNIVEVKSTDGVIGSVKLNGEEYGGGGGSSDFSTANVTVDITAVTDDDYNYKIIMPYISEGNGHKDSRGSANYWSLSGGVGTYQAILTGEGVIAIVSVPTNGNIETSGNIGGAMVPVDEGYQAFLITGDCTITIS